MSLYIVVIRVSGMDKVAQVAVNFFYINGKRVNVLGFVGQKVLVKAMLLCSYKSLFIKTGHKPFKTSKQ